MAEYEGKCSNCGRIYHSQHADVVVCDCWEVCPLCGAKMEPYTPDLAANTYGRNGRRDLLVMRVCNNVAGHSNNIPFFSYQRPVEVELEQLR